MFDAASRNRFYMNGETLDGYCHVYDKKPKNMKKKDLVNEVLSEFDGHVDLSSFRPQQSLHPKIWPNNKLNSQVRLKLLDIADAFIDFINVSWVEPEDIILTGSLANYNWSQFSDFDLHILMDFSKVDERVEFVREYFDSKRKIWNDEHEDLKIFGFPVELYVQDTSEVHTASGVYSLEENDWITKPEPGRIRPIMLNKFYIKDKVTSFCNKIERLEDGVEHEGDKHKVEVFGKKANRLYSKIRDMRRESLASHGEMGSGNIIFKTLRRNGYLKRLITLRRKVYDKINSIT